MDIRRNATILFLLLLPILLFSWAAFAQTISNPIQANTFTELIDAIANFAILLVVPASVLMILYAAVLYMFSAGDVEKVKKAHRAFTWALVGLAIVLTGKGLISIMNDVLRGGPPKGGGSPFDDFLLDF